MDQDFETKSDIEDDSDQEAYKKFIVICEDDETDNISEQIDISDNDTKDNRKVKQPNTNKAQFQKIIDFANVYNEDTTAKSMLDELWETLTAELNHIGPPIRSSLQWRRVWSVYKYNTKRSESTARDISSQARSISSQSNRQKASKSRVKVQKAKTRSSAESRALQEMSSTDERMVTHLGVLVQQQAKIIDNQEAIMLKLDKSNEILAEIAKRTPFQS